MSRIKEIIASLNERIRIGYNRIKSYLCDLTERFVRLT